MNKSNKYLIIAVAIILVLSIGFGVLYVILSEDREENLSLFDRPNNQFRCNMYLQTYLMFNSDESMTNRVAIQDNINTYYSIY
jgi:hypothetical protein